MDTQNILNRLDTLLLNSFAKIPPHQKLGVLFSAGVDSSTIAKYAKDVGLNPLLFTFGTDFSKDKDFAQRLAQDLQLPFHYLHLNKETIEVALPKVKQLLISARIDPNIMQVSLSLGFYLIAREAKKLGVDLFLSGQGSDELFGGYNKYLGLKNYDLRLKMKNDTDNLFKVDVVRDQTMTKQSGIDIYFPYLDRKFIDYVQNLPVELKIRPSSPSFWGAKRLQNQNKDRFWTQLRKNYAGQASQNDESTAVRKYILRELAKQKGLPDYIFNRPKNALQYSSGIQKIVENVVRTDPTCKYSASPAPEPA
ncbi:MAG: asparagine synthase C-terminal domain-containing protein [Patescibacteria group bacterium]|nr:asparagine synthase C-terminal domain-containing protein [Patescibacteria group bacterium]